MIRKLETTVELPQILLVESKIVINFLCTPVQLSLQTRCLYHKMNKLKLMELLIPVNNQSKSSGTSDPGKITEQKLWN